MGNPQTPPPQPAAPLPTTTPHSLQNSASSTNVAQAVSPATPPPQGVAQIASPPTVPRTNVFAWIWRQIVWKVFTTACDLFVFFLQWVSRDAKPQYIGGLCILLLLTVAVFAYVWKNSWQDQLAINGFALTLLGFTYTIYELVYRRTMAEVAKEAAKNAAERQNAEYYRDIVESALRALRDATHYIRSREHHLAALRLNDVHYTTLKISRMRQQLDDRWVVYGQQCRLVSSLIDKERSGAILDAAVQNQIHELTDILLQLLMNEAAPFDRGG